MSLRFRGRGHNNSPFVISVELDYRVILAPSFPPSHHHSTVQSGTSPFSLIICDAPGMALYAGMKEDLNGSS